MDSSTWAGVTQLVECDLAKVDVAGSNPVSRSRNNQPARGPPSALRDQFPSSTAMPTVLLKASLPECTPEVHALVEGQDPGERTPGAHVPADCGSGVTTFTGTAAPSGTPGGTVTVMS